MELKPETKIMELVNEYPWLIDFLPTIAPQFKRITIPAQREKMTEKATIEIASIAAGLTAEQLIEIIQSEITYKETNQKARIAIKEKIIPVEKLELDVGVLTPQEVNLMLKHLPIDFTFIDKDDRVAYYSSGKERIFPRNPGIIGRDVSRCHPPKSVHIVNNIIRAFKDGTKDSAEFWLQHDNKFIQIGYFAVRDDNRIYCGTVEVSQDVTMIRQLEGEQRLLDWTQ